MRELMSVNKQNYFKHRNKTLSVRVDRNKLGEREVTTLLTILNVNADGGFLKGKVVIDLGCGDQYIKEAFERRSAVYRGVDIEECNLEVQSFPVEDRSQDIAVCLALIEHLQDPGHFLAETLRILKPGGLLWLSTPDIQACGSKFWDDPTHVHPYTRASLKTLLRINGFTDVLVTPNYRCKPSNHYRDTNFNFFRARHLMPFAGITQMPVPNGLKGYCTGLFALAKKPNWEQ
jgi:2-polyprenyl-3-methyl-5-hydroxy-6-metoxy-1,4-benzoquinol methylase